MYSDSDLMEIKVYDALKEVIDPELGVNIVDLGLIYKISYTPEKGIAVTMTLSTKGCPMSELIMENVTTVLHQNFPDDEHIVELVWEPGWCADFITPAGKQALGM